MNFLITAVPKMVVHACTTNNVASSENDSLIEKRWITFAI